MRRSSLHSIPARQQGAVLFVSLILLVILTLIGVMAARLQTAEAGMARNEHNHQLAMQTAEAALRDAESNLLSGIYGPPQFAQNTAGLYVLLSEVTGPTGSGTSIVDQPWRNIPAGAAMTSNAPAAPAYTGPATTAPPQVIIESLPAVAQPGDPVSNTALYGAQPLPVYRITAHATGADNSASATLQSVFH
jgi:type IV pilus assembly protein PilX